MIAYTSRFQRSKGPSSRLNLGDILRYLHLPLTAPAQMSDRWAGHGRYRYKTGLLLKRRR
jgi:hypothetical protein